ncbi:MAG TPA: hypothetical protein VL171_05715 [Verrucomicrobiae bacterium]|nr:hypothetical protein [Verrucomicrobiae bacterium]
MKDAIVKSLWLATLLTWGLVQSVSAGTYANINVSDSSFIDWGGVPVLATATNGTSGTTLDLQSVSIANDESNIYLLVTYWNSVNPNDSGGTNVFLAFDTDNHRGTGFDILGLGLIGSEVGWQNDYPFAQSNGVFNTGDTITNGAAAISPYFSVTTTQEYAISRFATNTVTGQPVFPGNTFTVMVYANPTPNTDVLGPIQYTCATTTSAGPTYKTISMDASNIGAAWSGVPVAWTDEDGSNNPTGCDFQNLYLANDDNYLYVRYTLKQSCDPIDGFNTYIWLDGDNSNATGFNPFGNPNFGSEVMIINADAYQEAGGGFNEGTLTNADVLYGSAGSAVPTNDFHYRVSRYVTGVSGAYSDVQLLGNTIGVQLGTDTGTGDSLPAWANYGKLHYTFATNVPSTYAHITIDGDYSDWIGVPVLFTGTTDDGLPVGVRTVQMANDESNLYIRITYYTTVNPNAGSGVYLAFDTDNDTATGFDIHGLGRVGSEVGWQNDGPFAQSNGNFNVGTVDNGGAVIAPYNTFTSTQEYALPRSATYTSSGAPVFPGGSLSMLVYTDGRTINDDSGPIHYTFASAPVSSVDFRILSIVRASNDITLKWTAPGGTTNVVQAESGNYNTNNFVDISGTVINSGTSSDAITNQFTETQALTNGLTRFYRIRQSP